jgi:hypothetical protein
MKKSHIIIVLLSLFILSACGSSPTTETGTGASSEKAPFIVKTQKLSDFSGSTTVEKS